MRIGKIPKVAEIIDAEAGHRRNLAGISIPISQQNVGKKTKTTRRILHNFDPRRLALGKEIPEGYWMLQESYRLAD
jgi:hypothetical protein